MTTAEKLQKIDEGVEETIALNAELEQTLYGTDVDKTLDENVEQTKSDLQAIKDKIVEHGVEVADGTRTAEYASKVDDVFEAGKKAECDAFWDNYQDNGKRTNHTNAFSHGGWNNITFKPKYDIIPTNSNQMFLLSDLDGDMVEILNGLGIVLDTSNSTNFSYCFSQMNKITRIGEINLSAAKNTSHIFSYSNLITTIDKIVVKDTTPFSYCFIGCTALKEIRFEGTIGQNGLSFQWSTLLSHDSIVNVIAALSTTATGMTVTFSKTAVNNAFETSEGAADGGTSTEWTTLIGTKTNWTISFV